jgi:hypothetical protein
MTRKEVSKQRLISEGFTPDFITWWLDHTGDDGAPDNDWRLARKWAHDGWEAALENYAVHEDL